MAARPVGASSTTRTESSLRVLTRVLTRVVFPVPAKPLCGDDVVEMGPGVVLHLTSHLTHRVDCPFDVPEKNVLILTMLTGERHQ